MTGSGGSLDWLLARFDAITHADPTTQAIIWRGHAVSYAQLREHFDHAHKRLRALALPPGASLLLDADFSPAAIALLLAAIHAGHVVVPVAAHVTADRAAYAHITQAVAHIRVRPDDTYALETLTPISAPTPPSHPLLDRLRDTGHPGLVLFSSGSTGAPKASLHDLSALLAKYQVERHQKRIISFLLFDHIGGFNTLLYTLANRGCVIALSERTPEAVCEAIEQHRAQVLPTSPTFLNLLLMSEAWRGRDLSSLTLITYGTEMMPAATLARVHELLPSVRLLQTYGLSELGILRSKSRADNSLWVKVGGEDYQTRVVDGILHILARSSMLGYLNAPSPFDAEGWFNTHDEVEVDGEWLRFKGRKSEIINVGGEKVYPAEVESVLLELDNIADATVAGEPHPITGNIVVAALTLRSPGEDRKALAKRVRKHCRERLAPFKVPVKVRIVDAARVSERFKKERSLS
jgi:acyl-coenzyme A synthetase/AMP-(fatty) acid ligase